MTTITYIPQEGDPSHTSWHGHRFEANVPREITHPALLAQAANNPWFKVDKSAYTTLPADDGISLMPPGPTGPTSGPGDPGTPGPPFRLNTPEETDSLVKHLAETSGFGPIAVRSPPMSVLEQEAPGIDASQAPVGGQLPPRPQGRPPNPTNPTEYRVWVNRWLAKARSRDDIDERWEREEGLREACGVGSEDLGLIDTVMQPRRHELRAIEKAVEAK